jgi:hypothetical protein
VVMPALGAAERPSPRRWHASTSRTSRTPPRGSGECPERLRRVQAGNRWCEFKRPQPALRPFFMLSHHGQTPGMRL